jgi:Chromatin remodelling complex Rsc7/Swp82 subunit
MIALDLRRRLGYSHSSCLFSNSQDPRPILAPKAAVLYLKDRNLLPQSYRPPKLSVVKAFNMFQKFGHPVILNGVPVVDDYYTASENMDQSLSSSLPIPGTACFKLFEWNHSHPPMEESALLSTSARKTKPRKISPREEMENRNRAIRLYTGCIKNSTAAITID